MNIFQKIKRKPLIAVSAIILALAVLGLALNYAEHNSAEHDPENQWMRLLVNYENPLPDDFEVNLVEIENGHKVDERIAEPLTQMLNDAREDGIIPRITSSYRSVEYQQQLLDDTIDDFISEGLSEAEATEKALEQVALPGTSEHHTGLAVDISTADWDKQNAEIVWEWLRKNSYKYGFILRYTEEKQDITGIVPEPWHFRYVGTTAAKKITWRKQCLEEYLQH